MIQDIRSTVPDNSVRNIEIEVSIVVIIRPRGTETALWVGDTRGMRYIRERTVSTVMIKRIFRCPRPTATGDVEVRVTVIIVIGKERAPTASRIGNPSLLRYVCERPIPVIAIKDVRLVGSDGDDIQISVVVIVSPSTAASTIHLVHL